MRAEPDSAVNELRVDSETIRARAYELSEGPEALTPDEDWLRAERELIVAHDYDTIEFDLERLGMTVSRLPVEAGVIWRLQLARGERIEAWEPGNAGLTPPAETAGLIDGVVAGKELVPMPPLSADPGAIRLRAMIETQRHALLAHDPGTRLGDDPENLHQHRVAARRTRAFLRAARGYVDPAWSRSLGDPLRDLGEVSGPVRDLDVLVEHVQTELGTLAEEDSSGGEALMLRLATERESARAKLVDALDGGSYRALLHRLRLRPRLAPDVRQRPARADCPQGVRKAREGRRDARLAPTRRRDSLSPHRAQARPVRGRALGAGGAGRRALPRRREGLARSARRPPGRRRRRAAPASLDRRRSLNGCRVRRGSIAERQRARRDRVTKRLPKAWKPLRKSGARLR